MSASLAVAIISSVVHITVGVLLIISNVQEEEFEEINTFPIKSVLQQPIAYFKVDNDLKSLTNQHSFFYWEGTYMIWDC